MKDDEQRPEDSGEAVESWLRQVARVPVPSATVVDAVTLPANTSAAVAVAKRSLGREAPLPEPGHVLDARYRLDGVLGEGGMGVVYEATQLSTGKQVAIKWMRASEQRSHQEKVKAAERFVREAKAAARIEHPNVVDVYDVGGDPLSPYLVMERLRGETLRTRIERAPLTWDEAKSLLSPIMQALARAHAAGVVHRDLKPDNLFVVEQADGTALIKVLDFGVSRLQSRDEEQEISLTRTGAMVGTPVYMPLEQLRGEPDLDGRTDIYALGVVLYEALCGERPFPARNAAEYGALLASSQPQPISERRPEIRGPRERVVMRALARERAGRFPDMESFRAALLNADVVPEGPRRRVLVLAVALLMLGMLVTSYVLFTGTRAEPQTSRGALPARTPAPAAMAPTASPVPATADAPAAPAPSKDEPAPPIQPSAARDKGTRPVKSVRTLVRSPLPGRGSAGQPPTSRAIPESVAPPPAEPAAPPPDPSTMRPQEF